MNLAEEQLRIKSIAVMGLGLFALIALGSGIYLYLRNRIMRKRLMVLLEGDPVVHKSVHESEGTHPPSVPPQTAEEVLEKLEEFERSSLYLTKDLDLPGMA